MDKNLIEFLKNRKKDLFLAVLETEINLQKAKIKKKDLLKNFNISKSRYSFILKDLKSNNLL
jgi:hypothetical protein